MENILKQGWQSFDVEGCLKDTLLQGILKSHSYSIEENGQLKTICIISEHSNPNLTKALIFHQESSCGFGSYKTESCNDVKDKDIDLLKLKCLIKAKQLGWNIKKLN
jgi:hypothetical protein